MARLQVADGAVSQGIEVAANILHGQPIKGGSSAWGLGEVLKIRARKKHYTVPGNYDQRRAIVNR
jgi:hypothetical protein